MPESASPPHKTLIASVVSLLAVLGCTSVPDGVEVVDGFDLDRYLGKWYEIARLDHRFERGLSNVTANYSKRDDGGVRVINKGYNEKKKQWKEAEGKAYFVGPANEGRLKVSFFGPFYGGYNVVELDKNGYRYSLVAGPDRSYLWILARDPGVDPAIVEMLVARARALGFQTDELIFVDHARQTAESDG